VLPDVLNLSSAPAEVSAADCTILSKFLLGGEARRMKRSAACILLIFATSWPAGAEEPPRPTAQELIAEGVSLHDSGDLDGAVQHYKQALAIEPDSSLAWYELANAYLLTERYDLCEEAGRKGLKKPGSDEGKLSAVVASCLASVGKRQEALRIFEDALKKHPDDPHLNFNIAVTLILEGRSQEAVEHLRRTVDVEPSYAASYYALGKISADKGDAIPGIFYFMRFMFVQPPTERAAVAAAMVFELLTQGVSAEDGKDVTITLGPGLETKSELASLEVGRMIAAAAIHTGEGKKSKAERYVSALVSFVEIAEELTQGGEGAALRKSFVWEKAAAPVIQLEKRGVLECFGHILASWAGYEGAEDWIKKHPQKRQELDAALAELK
jgi:tetratricopeptide (TPR) repeat protein